MSASLFFASVLGACCAELRTSHATVRADDAPEIDFSGVKDDTPVGYDDDAAYYALLNKAAQQEQKQLRTQAVEFVARQRAQSKYKTLPPEKYPLFYEMLTRPDDFRGKPVLLKGHILRTDSYEAGENPYGIKTLYEAWIVTEDSQNHPATIVFTKKPDNLPLGEELMDGVEVAGYFLKLYTYPSLDRATRKAPLILAKTVIIRPAPKPADFLRSPAAIGAIIGTLVLLIAAVWTVQSKDRRRLRQRQGENLPERLPDFGEQE